jgi:hypothetical protein
MRRWQTEGNAQEVPLRMHQWHFEKAELAGEPSRCSESYDFLSRKFRFNFGQIKQSSESHGNSR